jgi:hypothetical protein
MAVIMSYSTVGYPFYKGQRRTATTVLAGYFDPRSSSRDVLTSVLNGVPAYKEVEKDQLSRRDKKREKRERDRERKRAKAAEKARQKASFIGSNSVASSSVTRPSSTVPQQPQPIMPFPFWRARPAIHIATNQRSMSVTPPPMPLSPQSTPGPSSSTTSVTSSKRPHTPEDDDFDITPMKAESSRPPQKKKRVAVKKGWKGWVEGSPPPSEKLINLDEVTVLTERKTRSGKSFDGIGLAKDDWV